MLFDGKNLYSNWSLLRHTYIAPLVYNLSSASGSYVYLLRCYTLLIYRVIHKPVKHFKNSQQMNYAKGHGNSYVYRERNSLNFFKEKPAHIVALICR